MVGGEGAPRLPGIRVGGRLSEFLPTWEEISDDPYVLSIVREGFRIQLTEPLPNDALRRRTPKLSPLFQQHISDEISMLLEKGAIEEVRDHPRLSLSPIFIIPKKSGKLRMILNMKRINLFVHKESYRLDSLAVLLPSLRAGDWAVSLDLQDAYFHVPIHPTSRDLLGFTVLGKTFRYRVLPFGLSPAPRVFTRVVGALAAFLREQGLRLHVYLDDWLLVASSRDLLLQQLEVLLRWTQSLGFMVNWDKSELVPTRKPVYLGAELDISQERARPSSARIRDIVSCARQLSSVPRSRAKVWSRFLGLLASLTDLVPNCRLLMRPFQWHLRVFFTQGVSSPEVWVPLSRGVARLLGPWKNARFLSRGKPFHCPLPSVTVTTDASLQGWGGLCEGSYVAGDWSHLCTLPHINVLELMAVQSSLSHFQERLRGHSVLILTDNVSVAAYINRQGGTRSWSLNRLAIRLWEWCLSRDILPSATYLPGQENLIADFLSRGRSLPSEWALHQSLFQQLVERWGPFDLDLFANEINHRLPLYCAKTRDPNAFALDAFSISWGNLRPYAFPPFNLIPRVLSKIVEDGAQILLIAPRWPGRSWFPRLLDLLIDDPWPLPPWPNVVSQPLSGLLSENPDRLRLTAWPLSGRKR